MKYFSSIRENKIAFSLSVIVAVFFVASVASAVTTISTSILTAGNITTTAGNIEATAGTLTIGGASTLTGNTAVTGTLDVTGKASLGNATTTKLSVGATGTTLTLILKGTCSLVSDSSIAATSTGTGTCVTTGSVAGDIVFVSLATTTTKMSAQYSIIGTVAGSNSTTVRLLNLTGVDAIPSATNGLGSSTQYWIVR